MTGKLPANNTGAALSGLSLSRYYAAQACTRHGHTRVINGKTRQSRTYNSWCAMRARCQYPKHASYPRYGGRGITVCPAWNSFEQFLADMGERPEGKTLDRIDNDKGYSPDNCRWATPKEQRLNQRQCRN